MIASVAHPVAYADDVLTLAFRSTSDVAGFKKLAAGKGPSEDLRAAIQYVLGVRVKYVAKHDPSRFSGDGSAGGGAPAPASGDDADGSGGADPDRAPAAPRAPVRPDAGAARTAPRTGASPASDRPARATTPTATASGYASAPVTEWAVAPIPGGDSPSLAAAPLAVDDEPEEAAAAPMHTLTIEREGDVLTDAEAPLTAEEEEELPPPVAVDAPIPPRAPVAVERPAPPRAPRSGGIERVGEAVVRQMLGATFLREEPYTPPTRFS